MSSIAGKDGSLEFSSNALLNLTDWSYDTTSDLLSVEIMGADNKTYIVSGLQDGTLNANFLVSSTTDAAWIIAESGMGSDGAVALILYPGGNTSGQRQWTGSLYMENYNISASLGEAVTGGMTFRGVLTSGLVA